MTEENENTPTPEWFDDDAKVDAFVDRHRGRLIDKLGLGDLFSEAAASTPDPAPKAEPKALSGGGQKVTQTGMGDAMTDLVSTLVKGIKAEAREEARKSTPAPSPQASEPKVIVQKPKTLGQRFWGIDD